jgi:N-acetylneuraminate synthase/N,N'-diacetyllegionaminate synthase
MSSVWQGKHGPLLIAEIGGNHEGSFKSAMHLLDLALGSEADVIKFQLYTGDSLVSPVESADRHRHFQRFELSQQQHLELAQRTRAAGKRYNASVWDLAMLEWIDPMLDFYKIGSGDLTCHHLLEAFARRGKPILLSTGLANEAEVRAAVAAIQKVDERYRSPNYLALLQCTSMYPTSVEEVNLKAMRSMAQWSGLAVGYSDHTVGDEVIFIAACMGAQILEFHFTDVAEGRSFRDHAISLTAPQVQRLSARLDLLKRASGSAVKAPTAGEISSAHIQSFRRAVYAKRALKAGELIANEDLVLLRPNHGIDAREFGAVVGRRVAKNTPAFGALELIEPAPEAGAATPLWSET